MTITYDPTNGRYLDEKDVRDEMTRVFDVCQGCRLCVDRCTSFPTMFGMIGQTAAGAAGLLTPAQQDVVVDECFHCKMCAVNCPYTPDQSELAIDFPRLMLRVKAMRRAAQQVTTRDRVTSAVLGRTDLVGRLASAIAPLANRIVGARPGSLVRKALEKAAGISQRRVLSPFAEQRFSEWFATRPRVRLAHRQATVAVFPTCLVEYQAPSIGQDLVKVYERNGVECTLAEGSVCCGAPYLQSGDIDRFVKVAKRNVTALAKHVAAGLDVVVPQPTCGFVLKHDYVDYVPGPDAIDVAAHTYDVTEYLIKLHKDDDTSLDLDFSGEIPGQVTYHTPCHLRAQNIGLRSRDLIKLTGAKVRLVEQCSGVDAMWGLRAENARIAVGLAERLGAEIEAARGDVVAGDCHWANTVITEQTGSTPVHPIQLMARAYGIPRE